MVFDPGRLLKFGDVERHPSSVDPDENAIIIPESMVVSRRGNEQLHVIPRRSEGGGIEFSFMTYVNGGDWGGKKWYGYVSRQKASPPILTLEGAKMLAEQLGLMVEVCK